jgi:hypothetical protein
MKNRINIPKNLMFTFLLVFSSNFLSGGHENFSQNHFITGTVSNSKGPVTQVWVILFDGEVRKGRSLTGDDGKYYIGHLDEKIYTVVVRKTTTGSNLFSEQVTLRGDVKYDINLP